MVTLMGIAAAAIVAFAPATRASDSKPDGRAAAAVELSRSVLSRETWEKTMRATQAQTSQQLAALVTRNGGSVDPAFAKAFEDEFSRLVPYDEVVDMQAGLLTKHYSERELRDILAFYRTPTGKKMIEVMPEIMADVSAWSMSIMQQRIAAVMEKLRPLMHAPGEDAPEEGAKDETAEEPPAAPSR